MFKLRDVLAGHEQDVRGVVAVDGEVASASRDGTAKFWKSGDTTIFHSPTSSFINAIEYIQSESLFALGSQDSMIYLADFSNNLESKYQLIGHQANVCALHNIATILASGSWDCTAKIWDLSTMSIKYDLIGHDYSVWDVKILDNDRYLTASADQTIRLWQGDCEIQKFIGHTDVVRKLVLLSATKFASCSNDGTIKIWDLEKNTSIVTLSGHDSFVYDLAYSNSNLISTSEDRTARIWSLSLDFSVGEIFQVITLPAISIWCVDILPNSDFVVGTSDKKLYVFTKDCLRFASEEKLSQFKHLVESSTISEQSLDNLNRTDIPNYDALKKPGKNEGAIQMVKNQAGVIEAHQWSGGQWVKIGDVVGGTQSNDKKDYEGKQYDYVFDVDIKDGEPPLKLTFNLTDNPYTAAENFLSKNELPSTYTEEVVKFINQNTGGFNLDHAAVPVENPYADRKIAQESSTIKKDVETLIIPEKEYILFKEFKLDSIVAGLSKLNNQQSEGKLSPSKLSEIESYLLDLNSRNAVELINVYIPHILKSWKPETKLLGFDLLRVAIPRILVSDLIHSTDCAQNVLTSFQSAFNEPNIAIAMMTVKAISNVIDSTLFIQLFIDPNDDNKLEFNYLFIDLLRNVAQFVNNADKSHKLYGNFVVSLSTLIFNLSAYYLKNLTTVANIKPILDFVSGIGDVIVDASSEAAYRLLIGYGNLKYADKNIEGSWLDKTEKYSSEDRFVKLQKDIKILQ